LPSRRIDFGDLTTQRVGRCGRRGFAIGRTMQTHARAEQRDGGKEHHGIAL